MNIDKSSFGISEVEYLDYLITKEGIKPDPKGGYSQTTSCGIFAGYGIFAGCDEIAGKNSLASCVILRNPV